MFKSYHNGKEIIATEEKRMNWKHTLAYVKGIVEKYGPFDGIVGFCEGASVASVALFLQEKGEDYGLGNVKLFIAMAPWRSPIYERDGLFSFNKPLKLPMLQIVGNNDMEVFLASAPNFRKDFTNSLEYRHNGKHVYPMFTPTLDKKLNQLLRRTRL